jgi:hypothetical protein
MAAQRSPQPRASWEAYRLGWPADKLVFVDESACSERTGDRKRGWSPVGMKSCKLQWLDRSNRYSVLPALTIDGYLDNLLIVKGGVTKGLFFEWFDGVVIPQLAPDAIVIMDNASIHRSVEFRELFTLRHVHVE